MSSKELKDIAKQIISNLNSCGFVIQRYDAVTTQSIYLKLDYGVCNSIRISNHQGKKHLKYRYNIILDGKTEDIYDGYIRHYYAFTDSDKMIEKIKSDREEKIKQYGCTRYREFMNTNKMNHKKDKGFWKDSYIVSDKR